MNPSALLIALFVLLLPLGSLSAAPGDVLFWDNFNSNLNKWSVSGIGDASIGNETADEGQSLRLRHNTVTVTSNGAIAGNVPAVDVAVWIRRGSDSFSEDPDGNEDLVLEYLNASSIWVALETFPGSETPGEIFNRIYNLPPDGLHNGLRVRFRFLRGSGVDWDYWHVDSLEVTEEAPPSFNPPVADWRFDELLWDGTPNEIEDSSGNNYHGRANNALTEDQGLLCSAGNLSGSSNSDYLSMNYRAMNGLGDFTLVVWGKTTSLGGFQTIVSGANGSGAAANELVMLFDTATRFTPVISAAFFNDTADISVSPAPDNNIWHQFVWTRVAASRQSCFYLDGVLRGCITNPASDDDDPLSISANGLILGQDQDSIGGSFDASQDWEGLLDEVLVFDYAMTPLQIQTIRSNILAGDNWDGSTRVCPDVDHYQITHVGTGGGAAVTCEGEPVIITAHDVDHHPVEPGDSVTITINTNTGVGDWSVSAAATGVFNNGVSDDGVATYRFGTGEEFVELVLKHSFETVAPHMDIDVIDSNLVTDDDGSATEDARLEFADAAFRFYAGDGTTQTANSIGTQISGKENNLLPGNQVVQIRSIIKDSDTGACEVALTGLQTVEMASQCINPGACLLGQQVTINNSTAIASNPVSGVTAYSTVNLIFNIDGIAEFSFDYSDAGLISLHAKKEIPETTEDPAFTLEGASNTFVVRPFAFGFPEITNSAGDDNTGGDETSGDGFTAAGEDFDVTVAAYRWQAVDDSNQDGHPDPSVNVTNNGITPNFRADMNLLVGDATPFGGASVVGVLSGSVPVPELDFASVLNGGGRGLAETDLAYSEVGSIQIEARSDDYLGDFAADIRGVSPKIGRFYPDHFILVSSDATPACGLFSYMGQTFDLEYTLQAQALGGGLTQNYDEALGYVGTAQLTVHGEDQDDGTDLGGRVADVFNLWEGGEYIVETDAALFNRDTAPDGAFHFLQLSLRIDTEQDDRDFLDFDQDPDDSGDCVAATSCTSLGIAPLLDMRYGRMIVNNAFGPELIDLDVGLQSEYYSGGSFVLNTDDNCSLYINTDASLSNFGGNLSSGETAVILPTVSAQLIKGRSPRISALTLSAPGAGNDGTVTVELAVPGWLKFDFDGDSTDDDPSGLATFGQFRGNDRVIYWREVFN